MNTPPKPTGFGAASAGGATEIASANEERTPTATAYVLDAESAAVVQRSFDDLGIPNGRVVTAGLDAAAQELSNGSWPRFLIVDISGIDDPLPPLRRLVETSDPKTDIVVIGDRNDIVLYRDLKAAGVSEYFYKPLVENLLSRAIADIAAGGGGLQPSRSGKLILIVGVRGGVGGTTIATNLAWHVAEVGQRRVLLLDLDLHAGDTALQLGVQPGHVLREALDDPKRIDELFLERGVVQVTDRLGLMAGLPPLSEPFTSDEEAVLLLLEKLLARYRYVIVDLPGEFARLFPGLLHLPSSVVLVSDASLTSVREVGRWRDYLSTDTPQRALLHVLNRSNADGALPRDEILRIIPSPDLSIRADRDVMSTAALGTKAVQECGSIREAMAALSSRLFGTAPEAEHSFWKRMFG